MPDGLTAAGPYRAVVEETAGLKARTKPLPGGRLFNYSGRFKRDPWRLLGCAGLAVQRDVAPSCLFLYSFILPRFSLTVKKIELFKRSPAQLVDPRLG